MNRPPLRLAALLSGEGRTLQNLVDRIEAGTLSARIEVVVASSPTAGGIARARRHGLPVAVVEARPPHAMSAAITETVRPFSIDYVVLAGFMHLYLFPDELRGRVLNIHPALLPAFGGRGMYGMRVHRAVLRSGARESGCTVHFADPLYDHGPVLVQRRVPVLPDDTPETLADRVFHEECIAYPEALTLLAEGRAVWHGDRVEIRGPGDALEGGISPR